MQHISALSQGLGVDQMMTLIVSPRDNTNLSEVLETNRPKVGLAKYVVVRHSVCSEPTWQRPSQSKAEAGPVQVWLTQETVASS